jgi:A/G-specific adenine glycosylase
MPVCLEASSIFPDLKPFRRRLVRWVERHGRDLPWRRTRDPYAILVSEVMLQQTQVATVVPYYQRWLARFPDFRSLARASEMDVLHAWQGLGYYARARNLHAAAKTVVTTYRGRLPADPQLVGQLPGVGRYTAGAIASFAFDLAQPIVDANIARVLARLTDSQLAIDSSAGREHLWKTAEFLLPKENPRIFNSALMELGALVCLPGQPRCLDCPVRAHCRATKPERLPVKKVPPAVIELIEPYGFTRKRNSVLLEQSRTRWRGMWILPRLSLVPKAPALLRLAFPFTHHRITLAVFRRPRPSAPDENQRWFPVRALEELPVPSPHRRALRQLLAFPS